MLCFIYHQQDLHEHHELDAHDRLPPASLDKNTGCWLDKDFAGENREKVLGADLRRAPLHWVLPNETLGLLNGSCL